MNKADMRKAFAKSCEAWAVEALRDYYTDKALRSSIWGLEEVEAHPKAHPTMRFKIMAAYTDARGMRQQMKDDAQDGLRPFVYVLAAARHVLANPGDDLAATALAEWRGQAAQHVAALELARGLQATMNASKREKTVTDEQVAEVQRRLAAGETPKAIGVDVGVSQSTITRIKQGKL